MDCHGCHGVHQAPLSIGFPRQEYWSGLSLPSSGDVLNQGIKSLSPALAGGFFTTQPPGKPSTLQRKKKKTTKPSRMFPHSHPLISYFQTPYPGLLRKLSRWAISAFSGGFMSDHLKDSQYKGFAWMEKSSSVFKNQAHFCLSLCVIKNQNQGCRQNSTPDTRLGWGSALWQLQAQGLHVWSGPWLCCQLSCGWFGSDDTDSHHLVTSQSRHRWLSDGSWALQKLSEQEPSDSWIPQACAPSMWQEPPELAWWHIIPRFYLQSISSGIGKHALGQRGPQIQQWMREELARDPQGALQLRPATSSSSTRLMFLPPRNSKVPEHLLLLRSPPMGDVLWRSASQQQPERWRSHVPFAFLSSKGSNWTSSSFTVAPLTCYSVCPDILGCLQLPLNPSPQVLPSDRRAEFWFQGQVTSSAVPQNKHWALPYLLHHAQLPLTSSWGAAWFI